ncbi:MAG: 3-phosphoshikimate 1-carboxyvinyltransferase, partial [Atopobiaceae bacterium]|nr:3-phosphoshikimate 1-carboxyvinyltransferase [Atopobiaceae bacterium]
MDVTIRPGAIAGTVAAIPSKSEAHRALICAAFAQGPTRIACKSSSDDIDATVSC